MAVIQAKGLEHRALNDAIRSQGNCLVQGCLGQRFIASGMNGRTIELEGIPGNALGAYLTGAEIIVHGNAQDAVGDTMNEGSIVIHGNVGDAAGYAMRGGRIFVKGNAGYRAGIHMKAYREKQPAIVIGGRTGSFLGEYQAGGIIVVLGLHTDGKPVVGNFPCTGMHGGRMYLRGDISGIDFPHNVNVHTADAEDLQKIHSLLKTFCGLFDISMDEVLEKDFHLIEPDSANPYKQMYVSN